ncbi:MAG: hypothetical protein A2008_06885 [Candidatus Wallbacteria bacterium GWC2_49_35]|uniref:Uncharacterized protein n=1 Tax=Candidatus Wallbacteria bacterium GWC2_49_35 TaxID=1817813 RepID=A0A1F7WM88_9BACT|nr:MAG: hypothetical protein A2008_06885 [Candidatus Wallbacteria bacterium GWC2_49_35]HBC73822.1 hypothetical protein [Candidatus Wallbacteria bacterium]
MTVKRWSKEDENFLMNSYSKLDNNKLADHFGVSKIAIQRKLARLKLLRQYQKKWTDGEEKFLHENFLKMSDRELAKVFNVTEISIKRKLARLGCRRNLRHKRQKNELKIKIIAHKDDSSKNPKKDIPAFTLNKKSVRSVSGSPEGSFKPVKPSKAIKTVNRRIPDAPKDAPVSAAPEKSRGSLSREESQSQSLNGNQYSCFKSYEIGELIYHKTWNDSGKVVKIIRTSGGHKAIVVEFSRAGQKTLLSEVREPEAI